MVLAVGEPSRSVLLETAEAISDAACVNPGRQTRRRFFACDDVPSCESHDLLLRVWFSLRRPNARHELLGMAGARNERTLFPVSSMPWFGR
jgi:hypothetical protein